MNQYSGIFPQPVNAPPSQRLPGVQGPDGNPILGHFDINQAIQTLQQQYPTAHPADLHAMAQDQIQRAQANRQQATTQVQSSPVKGFL